ncbi:MAG: DNA-directed RNA polymerase subunit beta' [Bacteroidia bacterium]|nr:MAG: DNA-directed RNA polymerase subunit beta' [Bacteroidia bacterium]
MAYRKDNKESSQFSRITISLASPNEILERSSGEVTKPETINYRTYKPERDGLFCERIFGPVKDYECHCGKYKRLRYKGIVCDRCGVEVTEKKVRRERTGHIELVVPVAHIWYFRSLPNKIGHLLGLPSKKLDSLIYYEKYVVINPGLAANILSDREVKYMDLLTEEEYFGILSALPRENQQLDDRDPEKFIAGMGAEAVETLLSRLDLDALSYELRDKAENETSQQRKADALKRLQVVEAFRESEGVNKPEWMILRIVPVIPPELRPLVPLDGGRFATSDLNDLYRRVIIRNNRLRKLLEIKAPEVILRNEKRMLQEAVDSLFDNTRRSTVVRTDGNRPLKSLSESLKGKRGRFRQNLLGKRVDYSARSVIVVGPELRMHECGLPKDMAAELYKPFIIRKLMDRGIVKTVKSAKKIVDRRDPVIWDILENVLKGHPVLLNRAPTLHRLGIQAFQPKLIEGKAIQLHPLACTAFNADFDGDQMAVHLPLGNAAILEAQLLMLGSHNILNPANGAPITVPSQDMVLGLYYITKQRDDAQGAGMKFYGFDDAVMAYNEGAVAMHAPVSMLFEGQMIETTVGRILFNQFVPDELGFINQLLTKRSLRDIIGMVLKKTGIARTAQFLDDIKNLGYRMAFRGGLSFNLDDVIIPEEKKDIVQDGYDQIEEVIENYSQGLITNNERYNQVIDVWTHVNAKLTSTVMSQLKNDDQGFNSVYMMLDSGARGSKEQIRQLCGMRGLMAKPQKSGSTASVIIENPILSNFKEGLSVLEYFISTHGARKGLADTALKTADAGYLTRRLVDVSQDVIVSEEDCGTLRGLVASYEKKNDQSEKDAQIEFTEKLVGRVCVNDLVDPKSGEVIAEAGSELTEDLCEQINRVGIKQVEIRSVLTCESTRGVCAKCYGRNLATAKMVQRGESVGIIAAQSIGEPGTQLTLRTFHLGGTAMGAMAESKVRVKSDGRVQFEDLRTIQGLSEDGGEPFDLVVSRTVEMHLMDESTGMAVETYQIPYGAHLYVKEGQDVTTGTLICDWDSWNSVMISEVGGRAEFESIIADVTYRIDVDEQTKRQEKVIIESRDRNKNPIVKILDPDGNTIRVYDLFVGTHLMIEDGQEIKPGDIIAKMPRAVGSAGDITGGLPRVTELFEARNPSNPAVVSEIDGIVSVNPKVKRGAREITVTNPKLGEQKVYTINLSKQLLVQDGDAVKAGMQISDGAITPSDILAIEGPTAVQEYIVNEVQDVYRTQGVKINNKHFEVIVRQMMRKVEIIDSGDTRFLERDVVDKNEFTTENDRIMDQLIVKDPGDSTVLKAGQMVSARQLRDENLQLKRKDLRVVDARKARPATASQILQGITRAALQTHSFMAAASFQETTKVLNDAAIRAKVDNLEGLKENVICGHLIPAGTGARNFQRVEVFPVPDVIQDAVKAKIAAARKAREE